MEIEKHRINAWKMIQVMIEEAAKPDSNLNSSAILAGVIGDCVANEVDCALVYTQCVNGAIGMLLNEHRGYLAQKKTTLNSMQKTSGERNGGEAHRNEDERLREVSECFRELMKLYCALQTEHETCLGFRSRIEKELRELHKENNELGMSVQTLRRLLRESKLKVIEHLKETGRSWNWKERSFAGLQEAYESCEKDLKGLIKELGKAEDNLRRAEGERDMLKRNLEEFQSGVWKSHLQSEQHQGSMVLFAERTLAK